MTRNISNYSKNKIKELNNDNDSEGFSSNDNEGKDKDVYEEGGNDEMSQDAVKELKKIFLQIFGSLNAISFEDIEKYAKSFRQAFPVEELRTAFNEWDKDGNGKLEFNEFVEMILYKTKQNKTDMRSAFSVLDRNRTGILSAYDLRHMLLSVGEFYTIEEIIDIIKDIDNDGDGFINFDEFLKLMNEELNTK